MAFTDIALRAQSYHAPAWLIGLILSSYFLFQIVMSPRWGVLSDRIGRRPVAITCTALSALSMLVYATVPGLWGIVLSRVLAGFAAANVAVVQATVTDVTEGDARTRALGRLSGAITLGLILGFAGGGLLAQDTSQRVLGFAGASLSGVATLLLFFLMPKTQTKAVDRNAPRPRSLQLLRDYPALTQLFLIAAIGWFALACLEGTFAQLLKINLGLGQAVFGFILTYEAVLGFGLQSFLFERIVKRLGRNRCLRVGYILQAAGLGLTPFAPNLPILVGASTLYAFGKGLSDPSMSLLTSEATPETRQGEMFGLLQSARYIGFLLGPSLGGFLLGWWVAAPYLLAAAVSLGASVLSNTRPRTSTGPDTSS